jgi:hypothetical protein
VWVNSNLSENRIEKERARNPAKSMQNYTEAYVNKIFSMVENRTINRVFP